MIESSRLGRTGENSDVKRSTTPVAAPPPIVVHQSAKSYLTGRIKNVLDDFLISIRRDADSRDVPITKIELIGYVDPEEGFEELVVQLSVSLATEEALAYWDGLGILIESWTSTLSSDLQNVVREQFAFDVQWDVSDPTT